MEMNSGGGTQMGIFYFREPCWISRSQLNSFDFYDFIKNAYFSFSICFF